MKELVKELGDELFKMKLYNYAIICYITSQTLETVVDLWKKRTLAFMKKGMDRNEALYLLFEKSILLKTVCKHSKIINDFDLVLSDMGEYLINEDVPTLAMKYLELANPKNFNVAMIKDRIFNSDSSRVTHK
jgi:hypothetical protein